MVKPQPRKCTQKEVLKYIHIITYVNKHVKLFDKNIFPCYTINKFPQELRKKMITMKISCKKFNHKPNKLETGSVVNEISKMTTNINPEIEELAQFIQNGQTLVIDNFEGRNLHINFIDTMYIGIDIDDVNYLLKENVYELTGEILKANGFDWYLRYKTFNFTKELPKHRYMLKFEKPLSKQQALKVYKTLTAILPIDDSTTKNLCRLWFGTTTKLEESDTPGAELNYDDFNFPDIDPEDKKVEYKDLALIGVKIEKTLNDIDYSSFDLVKYAEEVVKMYENWHHDAIYRSVYSVAVIVCKEVGDKKPFEVFLNNIPQTSNKTKLQRQEQYKIAFKNNVNGKLKTPSEALKLLKMLTAKKIPPNTPKKKDNRFNDYDLFRGLKKTNLSDRDEPFINANDIANLKGLSLLVAPAGSGKTTAIIDYALNIAQTNVVLIVPLIPIIEKLENKHQQYDKIEYLYGKKYSQAFMNSDIKLTICTTEAYYREKCSTYGAFEDLPHQLFIDEAHEVVSFFGIDGMKPRTDIDFLKETKGEKTKKVFHNIPDNTTFVTATPFNLADSFTQRKVFIKNTDKKVDFVKTKGSKATIVDILKLDKYKDKKALIYVNSKTKMEKLEEILTLSFPDLVISTIYSGGQKKGSNSKIDYENLMSEQPIISDVIITTKYLNVGVDINGVFSLVIYADNKLDINSCLQLFNRERKKCEFIVLHSGKEQEEEVFININSPIKPENIDVLMDSDINDNVKQLLLHFLVYDEELKKNIISQHIYVDQTKYRQLVTHMTVDVLKDLFIWFYPNIEFNECESFKELEVDRKAPITQPMRAKHYSNILNQTIKVEDIEETMFYNYKDTNKHADDFIKQTLLSSYVETVSRFEYMCIVSCVKKSTNIEPNILAFNEIEEHPIFKRRIFTAINKVKSCLESYDIDSIRRVINKYGGVKLFYLGDSVDIEPYKEAKKIGWCLKKLRNSTDLTKHDKERLCDYLNDNNFHYNNVKWTVQNFIARAEHFGFYYERKAVKIDGQVVKLTVNKTVYFEEEYRMEIEEVG